MIKVKGDPIERSKRYMDLRIARADRTLAALRNAVTKPVTKPNGGRPKRYETLAEKQRAYRERKKANED